MAGNYGGYRNLRACLASFFCYPLLRCGVLGRKPQAHGYLSQRFMRVMYVANAIQASPAEEAELRVPRLVGGVPSGAAGPAAGSP
jgi:hypothetical protein